MFNFCTNKVHYYYYYLLLAVRFQQIQRLLKQSTWDKHNIVADKIFCLLMSIRLTALASMRHLRRSVAIGSSLLNAPPISSCGLRLDNDYINVAVGLHLGTALCETHQVLAMLKSTSMVCTDYYASQTRERMLNIPTSMIYYVVL